jgi:2-oxoglutarate ferredoxin oxidoreductase subunit gamma
VDTSQIQEQGIHMAPIAANDIADDLGTVKMANIVALGAWIKATNALPLDSVREVVASLFAAKGEKLIQANDQALIRGAEAAAQAGHGAQIQAEGKL